MDAKLEMDFGSNLGVMMNRYTVIQLKRELRGHHQSQISHWPHGPSRPTDITLGNVPLVKQCR
jgi:hypothetical protein